MSNKTKFLIKVPQKDLKSFLHEVRCDSDFIIATEMSWKVRGQYQYIIEACNEEAALIFKMKFFDYIVPELIFNEEYDPYDYDFWQDDDEYWYEDDI